MNNSYNAFNLVRSQSSQAFQNIVPVATADNINAISTILLNQNYQAQLNEFITNLVNRIGLTIIRNKMSYQNPLEMFKKGSVPLGTDIQDLYENPAEEKAYELSNSAMSNLLKITDPDTHVAYYRLNRKGYYTKTISRENIQNAFVSWDAFNEFITAITNSLYSGNYIDEFKYTKNLIDGAYDNNKIICVQVTEVTNGDTAKALVKKLRTLYSKFKFPSSDYNSYSKFSGAQGKITTWTTPDRICVILPSHVATEIDVEVLAQAFNMDKADLMGRIVEVDEFENPEIQAIICDEAFLQIYDNLLTYDDFHNPATLTTNLYLHAWNTFAICPFANAVALVTSLPVEATEIKFSNASESVTIGTPEQITATLTPSSATADVTFISSNEAIFTVEQVSNLVAQVSGVSEGTASLFAKTDNGLSAEITINVASA